MRTVTVEVTQEDIEGGKRCRSKRCPIAITLRRTLGKACAVGAYSWGYVGDYMQSETELPEKAQIFIRRFDCGELVSPFTFTIEVPD